MQDDATRSTHPAATPSGDPLIGRVIAGKFTIGARLGAGAMGVVYRANQIALERTVAVKVLNRELATGSGFAERFWREAKAASRLDHANSIRVLDFGEETDGLLYLVMEYVEGCDLFQWCSARHPVRPKAIVDVLCQVLAALAVAHDMGVVHRDLKPENIMIVAATDDDGGATDLVKVCDFGIAKFLDTTPSSIGATRKHSTTGLIVGTPAYMSPEQARGEKQDARSDLYSVGIVLYELLTGRVPFDAESPIALALKHVSDRPKRPSKIAVGVDPRLEAICLKALSKIPSDRYQSAREMRFALIEAANDSAFGAPSSRLVQRHSRDSNKPTLVGVARNPSAQRPRAGIAFFLVAVLGLAIFARFRHAMTFNRWSMNSAIPADAGLPSRVSPEDPKPPPQSQQSSAAVTGAASIAPVIVDAPRAGRPPRTPTVQLSARVTSGSPLRESLSAALLPDVVPRMVAASSSAAVPPLASTVGVPSQSPALAQKSADVARSARSFDLALATVSVGNPRNVVGATANGVLRAVAAVLPRIRACYQSAGAALGTVFEGADVLHIDTDGAGVVIQARLSGPVRGSAAACAADAIRGRRISNVDTGSASADVTLEFSDH